MVNDGENGINISLVATCNDGVLPVDLLHDILLRLPARPLCRFRAVCRPWRALLSDPSFVAAHGARHPGPHLAVAVRGRLNAYGREVVDVHLVDASSGDVVKRICAGRCDRPAEMSTRGGRALLVDNNLLLRVLDPASGAAPLVPNYEIHPINYSFTLVRTASTGDYKVLRITHDVALQPRERQVCSVLALGGDGVNGDRLARWREVQSPPGNVKTWHKYVAVVDGVAYFVLRDEFLLRETGGGDWITAFDVEAEQWRPELVGGPPETFHNRLRVSLAALRGSLVVAQDDHQAGTLDLWFLLAGDGGKVGPQHWSKLYTVTMPYHGRPFRLDGERAEPVVVLDDGRIVFWVWERRVSSRGGVMRVYDPNTGGQTDVAAEANCVHVGMYTGSLLRPR
uniref:F-box domain-containing protein n=1 Tax=Oryza meridionalis TaxID=40149 RepID=A0A0E0D6I3_9ORYZ